MKPLLARVLRILDRFLRWWLGELRALVPAGLRGALAGSRGEVVVVDASGPEDIAVSRLRGDDDGRRQEVARLPRPGAGGDAGDEPPAALRGVLGALRRSEAVLRLPAEAALSKTVSLPLAAESSLHEILYFELDRQTPFRPDEVYFDFRVRERRPEAQRLLVELTVLARAAVDPLLAWLARFGLEPARVEGAAGPDGGEGWTCRLPAREEAGAAGGERPAVARMLNPALAVLAVVLAGVAVYVPIARQQGALAELLAELAVEKRQAEATLGLRETVGTLSEEALYLVNRKRATPSVLEMLDEITRVLPDHSFAAELRVQGRQVELVGQSEAATGLLDVVERSELFERATFRSPITRGRGGEAERFHLAFELVERGTGPGAEPEPERRAER